MLSDMRYDITRVDYVSFFIETDSVNPITLPGWDGGLFVAYCFKLHLILLLQTKIKWESMEGFFNTPFLMRIRSYISNRFQKWRA